MFTEKQIDNLISLLCSVDENTKIYMGTDSVRYKKDGKWRAKYATVCVVHLNGKNGCRVFKHRSDEPDYDLKKNRPAIRLMNEVIKTCELYVQLAPILDGFDCSIHLDINPDERHGSSCVAQQAAGYVLGVTGIKPTLKPDAWAASFGADHYA
jgi:uncharacterized protein